MTALAGSLVTGLGLGTTGCLAGRLTRLRGGGQGGEIVLGLSWAEPAGSVMAVHEVELVPSDWAL